MDTEKLAVYILSYFYDSSQKELLLQLLLLNVFLSFIPIYAITIKK